MITRAFRRFPTWWSTPTPPPIPKAIRLADEAEQRAMARNDSRAVGRARREKKAARISGLAREVAEMRARNRSFI